MKNRNREQKNWIYHRFHVVDNIQQSTENIGLKKTTFYLTVFRETALKHV